MTRTADVGSNQSEKNGTGCTNGDVFAPLDPCLVHCVEPLGFIVPPGFGALLCLPLVGVDCRDLPFVEARVQPRVLFEKERVISTGTSHVIKKTVGGSVLLGSQCSQWPRNVHAVFSEGGPWTG